MRAHDMEVMIRFDSEKLRPAGGEAAMTTGPELPGVFYATPSFFCRFDDDVVYWNTMRLSGKT
jgi:hypothetical protein